MALWPPAVNSDGKLVWGFEIPDLSTCNSFSTEFVAEQQWGHHHNPAT